MNADGGGESEDPDWDTWSQVIQKEMGALGSLGQDPEMWSGINEGTSLPLRWRRKEGLLSPSRVLCRPPPIMIKYLQSIGHLLVSPTWNHSLPLRAASQGVPLGHYS